MGVTLKDEKIIDRWSMLLKDGQENAEKIYQDTEKIIKESRAPGIRVERTKVKTG